MKGECIRTFCFYNFIVGFGNIYFYGSEGDFNVMVIEMLGPSLEDLFGFCDKHFTIKTICMLAIDLINRIESMH